MPATRFGIALLLFLGSPAVLAEKPRYVMAKAYHILPETTSEESGYFSLCEGFDGSMYIGTAKYDHNAYLVEFDPRTEKQRIVLDTNKVCGLTATGYPAQAKRHTRNYVGPFGTIYVGSKQGEPAKNVDPLSYPGGYVMTYDLRTGETANLGMPSNISGDHPDASSRRYETLAQHIDPGFAFGDACVSLDSYPVRLFAPSGVLQLAAYDAIVSAAQALH